MKLHVPVHERDQEAVESGLVLLDEYQFPHAVMTITQTDMNCEGLKYAFSKISTFLDLQTTASDQGLTIIVSPEFMFVALIDKPYHKQEEVLSFDGLVE